MMVLANVGAACCSLQPQEEQTKPTGMKEVLRAGRELGCPCLQNPPSSPIAPAFPTFVVPSCSPRVIFLYFHLPFPVAEESSTSVPRE